MHFDAFTNPYVRLTRVIGVNYTLFGACSNARAIVYFNSSIVYFNSSIVYFNSSIVYFNSSNSLHSKLGTAFSFRTLFYLIVLIAWSDEAVNCI